MLFVLNLPRLINIVLGLAAGVLFLGIIAEGDKDKHKNVTTAFVAVVLLIIAFNTVM